jgi:hypothetical protein
MYSHQAVQKYDSIIGNADADLSSFKAIGGKMITWHGIVDQIIAPNNSIRYYEDSYRLLFAPGIGHCGGGPGFYPTDDLEASVK